MNLTAVFRFIVPGMLFLVAALPVRAAIFYVTTNAASGTGSLRAAINDANASPGSDTIYFNIPGSDVPSRTITLNTLLPDISDMVLIDATTQPNGKVMGNTSTKIQITTTAGLAHCFNVLADSSKIFGFFINNFQIGIKVAARYVQIGAFNKGNVLFKNTTAQCLVQNTDHAAIIANYIGLDTSQNAQSNSQADGLQVVNSYAVVIGGKSFLTSNTISGNNKGVHLVDASYCDFNMNYIGTTPGGTSARPNKYGIYGTNINNNMEIGGDSTYERNVISANLEEGIYGTFTYSTIQGNAIGTDTSGTLVLGNGGRGIYLTAGSVYNLIGGTGQYEGNMIAYNGKAAIGFQNATCSYNSVRLNKVFCNSQTTGNGGFDFKNGNEDLIPPSLTIVNANGATGTTYPNAIVDLFADDGCAFCEGRQPIASVTANSSGVFSYSGSLSGFITATVTVASGSTSRFATCTEATSTTCLIGDFILGQAAACAGSPTQLLDASLTAPGTTITSWQWNFGDGNVSSLQNPVHTYASTGVYTITLTVVNSSNCTSTISKSVNVGVGPQAAFIAPQIICSGTAASFTDASVPGTGTTLTGWWWDFGDGQTSTSQNPVTVFAASGLYTVSLTVTASNGCTSTFQQIIQVVAGPQASFTFQQAGLQVTFTNTSSSVGAPQYSWDFGDGNVSTDANPTHTYAWYGIYNVCLTLYDPVCNGSVITCEVVDLPVSAVQPATENLLLAPNPTSGLLKIRMVEGIRKINEVLITDSRNRRICSFETDATAQEFWLDLSHLPAGMYFVHLLPEGNPPVVRRLVKQ
ncbi:MAG: PKD domain-containing protein [Chitinophagales bacterium]|nr:PKD domain-containing protein [Chitinophagales bacterium]MDW8393010.1 PKD domain-containing protein [Chitinophagales bacterium]